MENEVPLCMPSLFTALLLLPLSHNRTAPSVVKLVDKEELMKEKQR